MIMEKPRRTVNMDKDTHDVHVRVPVNSTFSVPNNVRVNTDERLTSGGLRAFASGSDVLHTMNADADFSASYMGVTVSGAVSYATASHFTTDQQYAFLSKNIASYTARITDYDTFVNTPVINAASALPDWNPAVSATVSKYKHFFSTYGTHTIVNAYYGWRFQLQCAQSNKTTDETKNFELSCKVKYLDSASASADFKTTTAYKTFEKESNVSVEAIGGRANEAGAVQDDPANLVAKQTWLSDAGTEPNEGIIAVDMIPISKIFDKLTDDDSGTMRHINKRLGMSLFDLQNGCQRRLVIHGVVSGIDQVKLLIKSPNGIFAASNVPGILPANKRWETDSVSVRSVVEAEYSRMTYIQSDSSASMTLEATILCSNITKIDIPQQTLDIFAERRKRGTEDIWETTGAFTVPVPAVPMSAFPEFTLEFTLDLKPELDFWWPQD
jgi:hypothetical protein